MSFTDEYVDTFRSVLLEPTNFFENQDRRDGFGFPLKFAAVNLIISGVLAALGALAFGGAASALGDASIAAGPVMAVLTLVFTPIAGLIGLFLSSAILHVFVVLLGGDSGYSETLAVMEYASAVSAVSSLFSMIPLLGSLASLVLGIYAVFIQSKGLQYFKNMSFGKALLAVLLPVIIVIVLIMVVGIIIMGAALTGLAATA